METDAAQRTFVSGPELREERDDAELTQEQVAAEMGVDRSTVSDYENKALLKPRIVRRYREAIARIKGKAA